MEDTIIKVQGKYEFTLPYLISLLLSVTGIHFLIESREIAARTLFPDLNMFLIGLSGTLLLVVFGLLSILFYSQTMRGSEYIHFNRRGFYSTSSFPHAVFIPWKELTDVKKAGFFGVKFIKVKIRHPKQRGRPKNNIIALCASKFTQRLTDSSIIFGISLSGKNHVKIQETIIDFRQHHQKN